MSAGHETCFTSTARSYLSQSGYNSIQQDDVCAFAYMINHNAESRAELNKYVGIPYGFEDHYKQRPNDASFLDLYYSSGEFGGAILYGNMAGLYLIYNVRFWPKFTV